MKRMLSGIVVVNKQIGMTSMHVSWRVKRILGASRAGHSGILDPDATGVLPVFVGHATKLSEYTTFDQKAYEATVEFGRATHTQDASGETTATGDPSGLTEEAIVEALRSFVGTTMQVPPMYSSIKINGKRAYALARKGESVDIEPRPIVVHALDVVRVHLGPDFWRVRFHVTCGFGTYIRTICHDLGVRLGVPAHMFDLLRTQAGPYTLQDAMTLSQVESVGVQAMLPPQSAVPHLPVLRIEPDERMRVTNGTHIVRPLAQMQALLATRTGAPYGPEYERLVRVEDEQGTLLGVYDVTKTVADGMVEIVSRKVIVPAESLTAAEREARLLSGRADSKAAAAAETDFPSHCAGEDR
jgi:tRNA pseudouridine55 synthase